MVDNDISNNNASHRILRVVCQQDVLPASVNSVTNLTSLGASLSNQSHLQQIPQNPVGGHGHIHQQQPLHHHHHLTQHLEHQHSTTTQPNAPQGGIVGVTSATPAVVESPATPVGHTVGGCVAAVEIGGVSPDRNAIPTAASH